MSVHEQILVRVLISLEVSTLLFHLILLLLWGSTNFQYIAGDNETIISLSSLFHLFISIIWYIALSFVDWLHKCVGWDLCSSCALCCCIVWLLQCSSTGTQLGLVSRLYQSPKLLVLALTTQNRATISTSAFVKGYFGIR